MLPMLGEVVRKGDSSSLLLFSIMSTSFALQGSLSGRREKNLWRRKHRHLTQCFDSHVKTLVMENYKGIKSHISFASFFLLNARELELMRLEVEQKNCNEEFFAQQRLKLQFEGRACRSRLSVGLCIKQMPLSYYTHRSCSWFNHSRSLCMYMLKPASV